MKQFKLNDIVALYFQKCSKLLTGSDQKNMLFDDNWFLSSALLSTSFHGGMAEHNSGVQASLVDVKILGLYFILCPAGIALRVVVNAHYMPKREVFQ